MSRRRFMRTSLFHGTDTLLTRKAEPAISFRSLRYALNALFTLLSIPLSIALLGCGYSSHSGPIALSGQVLGGRQPVSGAEVQLYASGTTGNASAAVPLLQQTVKTDNNGNFSIPAEYGCPSSSSQLFVIAQGGSPALGGGGQNPALALSAALGACSSLTSVGSVAVNEVTTVGSVWPLAAFMSSATNVGSPTADPGFLAAIASVPEFVNLAQGTSPGSPTGTSSFTDNAKLNSLANLLGECVESNGDASQAGSPCGRLFALATPAGGQPPANTISAALAIAQNPESNVDALFTLGSVQTTFQPMLTAAPHDWTLSLTYLVASPVITPAAGTFAGAQQVAITDSTAQAVIRYTTDGTVPNGSSTLYSGPFPLTASATIEAVALLNGSQSAAASSTITITGTSTPQQRLVFAQQPSNVQEGQPVTPSVQVTVTDSNGKAVTSAVNPVTVSLSQGSGLNGTLTAVPKAGVATFTNLSIASPGTYTLTASSNSVASAVSSAFTVSGVPATTTTATMLGFQQQPTNANLGTAISPAVTVALEDATGRLVPTAAATVTLVLSAGGHLGGTVSANTINGVATFSNLTVDTAGSNYTLTAAGQASSQAFTSATSHPFAISAAVVSNPARLAFTQEPSNGVTGAALAPFIVSIEDSNGNTISNSTSAVTLSLTTGSGLTGTLSVNAQSGIATFSNVSIDVAGTYLLSASSSGVSPATSTAFSVISPASGPPTVSCSPSPATVPLGGTATVTATAQSPSGRALTYTWNSSAGEVVGGGRSVTLNTSGAPVGTVMVTCSVVDSAGLTAASTAKIGVQSLSSGSLQPAQCLPPTLTQPAALASTPVTLTVPANAINVLANGATGDGQTNDTPALQAIVNKNPSGFIYFPAGQYVLHNADENTPGLLFQGFEGVAYVANGARFLCDNATSSAGQCIDIVDSSNATFDNFRVGYVDESQLPLARNEAISNGILVVGSTNLTFNNTTVEASTGSGIWTTGSTFLNFLNGTSVSNTAADGIHFENVGNSVLNGFASHNTGDDAIGATNIATSGINCGMDASNIQIFQSHSRGIAAAGSCGYSFSNFLCPGRCELGCRCTAGSDDLEPNTDQHFLHQRHHCQGGHLPDRTFRQQGLRRYQSEFANDGHERRVLEPTARRCVPVPGGGSGDHIRSYRRSCRQRRLPGHECNQLPATEYGQPKFRSGRLFYSIEPERKTCRRRHLFIGHVRFLSQRRHWLYRG